MKLTLGHLESYLTSGLWLHCQDVDNEIGLQIGELQKIDLGLTVKQTFKPEIVIGVNDFEFYLHEDEIKPILHSLSDLTNEITINGETFVPMKNLLDDVIISIQLNQKHFDPKMLRHGDFDLLIKWHFDLFGLIEQGRAIDVGTLETNPYE